MLWQQLRILSRAVAQCADSVVITDRDGRIEYVNPAFEALTGYDAHEVRGKTPRILKSGAHPTVFYEEMWRQLLAEGVWRGVIVNRKKCGENYYTAKTITAIRDTLGRIAHFVSTDRDITEARRAEEELHSTRERLLQAEIDKKLFYRQVIRSVTRGRFMLVERDEIPNPGVPSIQVELAEAAAHVRLRRAANLLARAIGIAQEAADGFELAVGEAAGNAVRHGRDARGALLSCDDRILVHISDHGEGIRVENLPATIFERGFSTKISLGMGFTIMLELADRIWLATGPEGTDVVLEKWRDANLLQDDSLDALVERFSNYTSSHTT